MNKIKHVHKWPYDHSPLFQRPIVPHLDQSRLAGHQPHRCQQGGDVRRLLESLLRHPEHLQSVPLWPAQTGVRLPPLGPGEFTGFRSGTAGTVRPCTENKGAALIHTAGLFTGLFRDYFSLSRLMSHQLGFNIFLLLYPSSFTVDICYVTVEQPSNEGFILND